MNKIIDLWGNFLDCVRDVVKEHEQQSILEERNVGIRKAVIVLGEAGLNEKEIAKSLQEHWDLSPSEAQKYIVESKCAYEE